MSRMRQIPVMDINQREKMLTQNRSPKEPAYASGQSSCPTALHPMQMNCRPCYRKLPTAKFRLTDTPSLIRSGCNSVREFCNGVQHITVDLNHLVSSVESMLPLLTTYLSVLQNRNAMITQDAEPVIPSEPVIESAQTYTQTAAPTTNTSTSNSTSTHPQSISQSIQSMPPMPQLEDIEQLLEHPLVHNLLNAMIQNGGIPNFADSMRNADASKTGNRPDTFSYTN